MEIAPSCRFAYIANRELGVLSIFDTTRNAVTGTIKLAEGGPQFVAFTPDGKRAYVSIFNNARTVNVVGVLDTTTNAFGRSRSTSRRTARRSTCPTTTPGRSR